MRHRAVRHGSRMTAQAGAVIEARPAAVAGGGVDDTGWSDALRQELLEHDVRVVCVEPGAVATELPEHISHPETRQETEALYHGQSGILAAEDIASLIVYAVTAPERVSINEVLLRPLRQLT